MSVCVCVSGYMAMYVPSKLENRNIYITVSDLRTHSIYIYRYIP